MSPAERTKPDQSPASGASPWAILHRLLIRILQDRAAVAGVLSSGLSSSRLSSLPRSSADVLSFTRLHVLPHIEQMHGPWLAKALVRRLGEELGEPVAEAESPSSPPPFPKKVPSIAGHPGRPLVLVTGEPLERASVARALVSAGYDVRSDFHPADPPELAFIDFDALREGDPALIETVRELQSTVPVVLRSSRPAPAIEEARALSLDRTLVVSKSVPLGEIIAHVHERGGAPFTPALDDDSPATARASFERISVEALGRVPRLLVDRADIPSLDGDKDVALLLAKVDGTTSLDELATYTGMTRAEVVRIVQTLVARKIIALD